MVILSHRAECTVRASFAERMEVDEDTKDDRVSTASSSGGLPVLHRCLNRGPSIVQDAGDA
jgi:hypothetical protein